MQSELCAATVRAIEPSPAASSSITSAAVSASRPAPPSSTGTASPVRPSCASSCVSSGGNSPASLHWSARGASRAATNARTVSRTSSWSARYEKFTPGSGLLPVLVPLVLRDRRQQLVDEPLILLEHAAVDVERLPPRLREPVLLVRRQKAERLQAGLREPLALLLVIDAHELAELRRERSHARDLVRDGRGQLAPPLPERDRVLLALASELGQARVDRSVVLLRHARGPPCCVNVTLDLADPPATHLALDRTVDGHVLLSSHAPPRPVCAGPLPGRTS